jgi:hypothetical protein
MFASTATIAISLFFGLVALAALLVVLDCLGRGLRSGRAILAELAELEAGRRPAPPVRTVVAKRPVAGRSDQRMAVRPLPAWRCAAA